MEDTELTDKEYLDRELCEIEKMQEEVERILHHKNPIMRWLLFNKAKKLHEESSKKLRALSYPNVLPSQRKP